MDVRRGKREELGEVGALLEACGLPPLPQGVSLSNVLVGFEQGSIIGVVALDVVARRGLTLWVAVSAEHRARGLGTSLVRSLISRAEELGLRELYAVSRDTSKFFAALGFQPVSHGAVPGEVSSMRAYPALAPDAMEVMRLDLGTRF